MDEENRLIITNIHSFAGIIYTIKQQEWEHDWFALPWQATHMDWFDLDQCTTIIYYK